MGIFSDLLKGTERRDHPSNPRAWLLWGLPGGIETYTGKNVNEDTALSSTAFWAAIKFISETTASLPLHLYKRLFNKGKERGVNHSLYNVLHLSPNSEMTSMNYREAITGQCIIYGNCYSEIEFDGYGNIIGLWPLQADKMLVRRINNVLLYEYRLPEGGMVIFPRERILHIPAFGNSGISGYNLVTKGREAIGLSLALEEYAARFFGNGAKPGIVLEHPGVLGEKGTENLRKSWTGTHEGLSKAHRLGILEEGMKLHEYGVSPEDAQAIEARKFSVTEIARLTNLPPHILKDLDRASFNNIEQMSLELVVYSLRPWMVRFEQNYTKQLLSEKDQKKYFVEHLIDGLLRGDTAGRWQAYTQGFQMGVWAPNDILEMENKNPYEGGEQHFVQLNMVPVDMAGEIPKLNDQIEKGTPEQKALRALHTKWQRKKSAAARMKLRTIYHRLFVDAGQRVVNKEVKAVRVAIKKHFGERDIKGFESWLDSFYGDLPEYVKSIFAPVIRAYAEAIQNAAGNEIGVDIQLSPGVEKFIDDYLDSYSVRHIESSIEQLKALVKETAVDDLQAELDKRVDEWGINRADKIGQRETVRADGAFTRLAFATAGVTSLVWVAMGDSCPWCASLDGQVVGIEQPFLDAGNFEVNGQPMMVYGPKLHPQLHDGCQCQIMAA